MNLQESIRRILREELDNRGDCNRCNSGLGHFEDNLELLNNAIEYIKHNS